MVLPTFGTKPVFSERGGLQLSENTTFMLKFVGTIKWGAFLDHLAGSFAPEVVFKARILISKQTALFFPIVTMQDISYNYLGNSHIHISSLTAAIEKSSFSFFFNVDFEHLSDHLQTNYRFSESVLPYVFIFHIIHQ